MQKREGSELRMPIIFLEKLWKNGKEFYILTHFLQ